jgi:GTPase SAR1 family protein
MAMKLRKPILVGGVGISVFLWLWDSFHQSVIQAGELTLLGAIALGSSLWLSRQKQLLPLTQPARSSLKLVEVEQAIANAASIIDCLAEEAPDQDLSSLKQELKQLPESLNRQDLQIAITGAKNTGKTSLQQLLSTKNIADHLHFKETESLFSELDNQDIAVKEMVLASDLVLFLTTGDLTDSQWQIIQYFNQKNQRLLLVFNQKDLHLPEEQALIIQQLRQRLGTIISAENVVCITTAPRLKVRQYQTDGTQKEWIENPEPELENLIKIIADIVIQEKQQLVWGSTWRQAKKLRQNTKNILNKIRCDRSLPIVEKYQWISAATAFANPVTGLDLLATAAINTQMLIDLSEIYKQKFTFNQAQTASVTIGEIMVKLGLVELATQAIASILKSNAFTYIAGGTVQGISAAYLTRLAGLSLIAYFQELESNSSQGLNLENLKKKLQEKLQQIFQDNQRAAFFQNFVKQTINNGQLTMDN